ncbi:DUF1858 domain-containing protein [bacterium]|jgi:hybrid cluster-associated redox disulfide protein|nr:DUF1858 domain-containing protein [bacterium]MBT6831755.1 DUF1858 domain-containing protein [bacterium]MBT6996578.1 DUF1858 domain-containing protein [bacterium]MBT7772904.1 DUF1858 domain-containing protein [bacterium]
MTSAAQKFFGTETVAEILEKMPEAAEILSAHGLACAGCAIGNFETLADGIAGHGMSEKDLKNVLQDLNEAADDLKIFAPKKNPELTKLAAEKVFEFQKTAGQENSGFKIEALFPPGSEEVSYFLDFLEKPEPGDSVLKSCDVKLFLSAATLRHLKNCVIDFLEDGENSGFKIEKIS